MHMEVGGRLAGAYPVGPRNSGHRLGGKSLYPPHWSKAWDFCTPPNPFVLL